MEDIKGNLARVLIKAKVPADGLTWTGLLAAFLSGFLIYRGEFFWGSGFLFLAGLFDLLDGSVARLSGKQSVFGGILDSSLDRYGDGFVFFGIIFYYAGLSDTLYALLAAAALLGSFAISYVRARAECEMDNCRVGFWERGERIVFVALGLLFNNLEVVVWILAIGTHWTTAVRLYYARNYERLKASPSALVFALDRGSKRYVLKAVILFLIVAFARFG